MPALHCKAKLHVSGSVPRREFVLDPPIVFRWLRAYRRSSVLTHCARRHRSDSRSARSQDPSGGPAVGRELSLEVRSRVEPATNSKLHLANESSTINCLFL